jgi:hypothetical protein
LAFVVAFAAGFAFAVVDADRAAAFAEVALVAALPPPPLLPAVAAFTAGLAFVERARVAVFVDIK